MKGKRSKQYRKLMEKYQLTFSFREPYQVLLDSQIIIDAARFKMNLGRMLGSTLHGQIKPMITQCSIRHLYNAPNSPEKENWIAVAKQAERRRCGHHELEEPLTELECLESVVDPKKNGTNKFRYVVASQEGEVRKSMREVVGVPLIYISRSVMILEPMAERTERVKEGEEKAKVKAGLKSRRGAEKRKRDEDEDEDAQEQGGAEAAEDEPAKKKKKVKGPKGPNPLSVKKTKKEDPKKSTQAEEKRLAIRKATKTDPQAAEKSASAVTAAADETGAMTDGSRKRKRKRKPKDTTDGGDTASVQAEDD